MRFFTISSLELEARVLVNSSNRSVVRLKLAIFASSTIRLEVGISIDSSNIYIYIY